MQKAWPMPHRKLFLELNKSQLCQKPDRAPELEPSVRGDSGELDLSHLFESSEFSFRYKTALPSSHP